MGKSFKASLFGAVCGMLLFAGPSSAGVVPSGVTPDENGVSAFSLTQQVSRQTPAGARCVKWTRRWNTRHGFGHRRCVQWR